MVNKKTKTVSKSNGTSAPTNLNEWAGGKSAEESPAPEASVSVAETVAAAVKPVAEKAAHVAKKITKTKAVAPIEGVPDEKAVEITSKKSAKDTKDQSSEKSVKMKRLTLDISKPLHKAIKAKAVEEGIPMVDMLRSLLEKYYGKN
ncbi:hypothetical protein C7B65_10500 [Phormidesmis priestleyi ULC007]|uniref:Uncharacterized protein n=1 Tax=Phormidesmis priestleyi ULC007 TaxID=1920490 RepID=A0A2T1DGZ7_9CYAN|nr:hypothetical protein [Phormidesmis priestleyi]PSB19714.1 hypothetical protein C7B65_10500 [Phormidesmis priestleyi ULC007]PZO53598.1 MAG: hypothetical protein DCF14_04205 [Phormidesmis priestleyi]